ncbi:hypothetical protein [Paramaledivibacter caminithermalis]|jgi:hypothetical protein|uniref:Uncharacterized protein n=1 Tax=Paramaledivibacter caminithermalis (strain DSM 15212 / CIP 107654 / DViRD3) TaxID=1121301 RepID=A0A1M6NAT4_PARC5|nr:hypothetical protein [Paramaledivibacter caminithermalis]SHJ92767.1 hypothetical protein SAMN02745912_01637 [Paramaledivibacter caminithermalis DSM 15212]
MAIRRRTVKESSVPKEVRITMVKKDLKSCNEKIKELTSIDTDNLTDMEKLKLERAIKVEELRRDKLKSKLSSLGYEEKRGRPRKIDSEKYDSNRSKFTAMLLTENLDYLKELKATKKIKNISAFLDELIENYRYWKGTS